MFSSGGHLVYRNKRIFAILLGSHLCNIPEKFESHWSKGLGGDSIYSKLFKFFFSIFSSGDHFVHWSETFEAILIQGHVSNIPMKFE